VIALIGKINMDNIPAATNAAPVVLVSRSRARPIWTAATMNGREIA
jgi:hypothetical protein